MVLRSRGFAETSLAMIAKAAALTTGAVYSAFGSKATLLEALERNATTVLEDEARIAFASAPADSAHFIDAVVEAVAATYTARRGTLRSLALEARMDPALAQRLATVNRRIVSAFSGEVARRYPQRDATRLQHRSGLAFLVLTSALRDRIVFATPWPTANDLPAAELNAELASMVFTYLDEASAP